VVVPGDNNMLHATIGTMLPKKFIEVPHLPVRQ
jgi:hypothetical protein